MNETRHMREASDSLELGLPCKDSAARIKRMLTVVPNAASDLHTPVPGRTFRGDETIVIDNLTCRLWLINVCASYRGIGRARRSLWGHENVTVFDLVWVLPINHLLIRAYGNILCVDYSHVLWWAAAAELMIWLFFFFTGDGLKFTFDLSLPGKRTSRKSPNTRKVRKEDILVLLRSFPSIATAAINPKETFIISCFSYQALPVYFFLWCWSVCVAHRSRWSTTTRRAGAVCRTVWRERTAQICWSGEEEAAVHTSARPQYCSWCCLLCDSLCSVVMMPSGSLFVCFPDAR